MANDPDKAEQAVTTGCACNPCTCQGKCACT